MPAKLARYSLMQTRSHSFLTLVTAGKAFEMIELTYRLWCRVVQRWTPGAWDQVSWNGVCILMVDFLHAHVVVEFI